MAIDITLLADVKGFLRGTKDASEGLEDVADALDDLEKDGEQATEKLEKGFKELADASKRAGDDVGDGMKKGFNKAEEGVKEFGNEANSTAKESAASFDGSAESIVDSFQEIAANAFAGFGPAGAIAGLAMAAGIGLAVKGFEDNEVAAEELRVKVGELTEKFIESGKTGSVSLEQYIDTNKEMATVTDDAEVSLVDLDTAASGDAKTMQELAEAMAGLGGKTEDVIKSTETRLEQLEAERKAALDGRNINEEKVAGIDKEIEAVKQVTDELKLQAEAEIEAANAQEAANAIGLPALEARAAMTEMVDDAYDEAAGSALDFVNKETGLFDVQAYIASMQEREKALQNYQTALASSGLTPEAKEFLNSQGAEAASLMLEGYAEGDEATKAELSRIWTEAGKEGSGAADKAIKDTFKTPAEAKVAVKADTAAAEKVIDAFATKNREIRIKAIMVDREGKVLP